MGVKSRQKGNRGKGGKDAGSTIFSNQAWRKLGDSLGLSARELQIVREIFDDQTEGAMAEELRISPHTVHTYIERLHRKLGVVDRVELVLRVTGEFLRLTRLCEGGLPAICGQRESGKCPLES